MAQRTGAERFLAPAAKSTSARVTLALVAAAFLLAGCGGGTSQESSPTTSASAAPAPKGPAPGSGAGAADSKSSSGAGPDSAGAGGSGPGGPGSQAQGQGQKHGPPIATPTAPAEQAPSAEEVANATVADISLQSPAIVASAGAPGRLGAAYTCDGKNNWPTLQWGGVPPGSAELILFAMSLVPVQGKIFVDWALAGLDPGLREIESAKLPPRAVVGENSFGEVGYSICPPRPSETYVFALYALPRRLGLGRGFDALAARKAALAASGHVGLLPAVAQHG